MASTAAKRRARKAGRAAALEAAAWERVKVFNASEARRVSRQRQREHEAGFKVITCTDANVDPDRLAPGRRPVDHRRGFLGHDDRHAPDPFATPKQVSFRLDVVRTGGGRAWEHPEHVWVDGGLCPCEGRRRYPQTGAGAARRPMGRDGRRVDVTEWGLYP